MLPMFAIVTMKDVETTNCHQQMVTKVYLINAESYLDSI